MSRTASKAKQTGPVLWQWPQHKTTEGSWCPFSGMQVEKPADWDAHDSTRCGHDCPDSTATRVTN